MLFKLIKNKKTKKGFTLVETLIAISILMLAVTGPLYFASESLKAATYARDQITAFYLAQDAFEQIRKIRDDNIYNPTSTSWNTGLTGCETGSQEVYPCRVNPGTFYLLDMGGDKKLYMSEFGVYSHSGGKETIFSRSVKITPMDGDAGGWENSTEMKVTVKIDWNSRGVSRSFEAYEFLRKLNS